MKRYAGLTGNCKKLRIKSHSKKQNVVVVALVLVVGFQILASIQATLSKIGVLQGNLFDYECGIKQEG